MPRLRLEIADIFVVNKADRPEAASVRRDLRSMLALTERESGAWRPPVLLMSAQTGEGVERVVEALASRYDVWQSELSDDALLAAYAERCDTLHREVLVHLPGDRTLRGRATGLDPHGALVVRDDAGLHTVHAGDVVHVRVP